MVAATAAWAALVLFQHRPDSNGDCVSCSHQREGPWPKCVHAYAARIAVRQLNLIDREELDTLLCSSRLPVAAVHAARQAIASIDPP